MAVGGAILKATKAVSKTTSNGSRGSMRMGSSGGSRNIDELGRLALKGAAFRHMAKHGSVNPTRAEQFITQKDARDSGDSLTLIQVGVCI